MFDIEIYGEGADLVILHGNPVPPESMSKFINELKDHFRVLVPNALACGLNGADQLEKLDETLAANGVKRASFLGHSYGAFQSFHMATRGNVEVSKLVALSPLAYYPDEVLAGYQELAPAIEADAVDIVEVLTPSWLSADYLAANPSAKEQLRKWLGLLSKEQLLDVIRIECDLPDLRGELPQIEAPVYIRVGALDLATPPAWSEEIHGLLPNSTLHIIEGSGHFLQMEDARATLNAVRGFLTR